MTRTARRQWIETRLRRGPVASQEALVAELEDAAGQTVTQATVSRDLAALGAIRTSEGYTLPTARAARAATPDRASASGELDSQARRQVVDIIQADSLIVVRTAPGYANALAVVLDRAAPRGVVGTIAGDDTVFLAARSRTTARELTRTLRRRWIES
ncbi:MAG: arginine repressor [Phycisphaerales bacterium]